MTRRERRLERSTDRVLLALGAGNCYGVELYRATRLSSGSLYEALAHLEATGIVVSDWDNSVPRRRVYSIRGVS